MRCSKCSEPLPVAMLAGPAGSARCAKCDAVLETLVFPALFRKAERGDAAAARVDEAEASCFYHPAKQAVRPCDHCGRFVCALCDVALNGAHLCPTCLAEGRGGDHARKLMAEGRRYDRLALALATWPLLVWPFTLFTAPAALFVAFRFWKRPGGLLPRGKSRFVVAILLSLAQIVGWGILVVFIIRDIGTE
jgi:hypothetical protein